MVIYIYENDDILHQKSTDIIHYANAIVRLGRHNWIMKNRRGNSGPMTGPRYEVKNARALELLIELLADNNIVEPAAEAKLRLLSD